MSHIVLRCRLKVFKNMAWQWATASIKPKLVRSMTTKGQMEPTSRMS